MGGICYWTDLDNVDFSRFPSVRLNVRFRSEGDAEELAVYLRGEIQHFTELVERWWRRKSGSVIGASDLRVDVTIDICPKDPGMDDSSPVNEINLRDIRYILMVLARMPKPVLRIRSVEVGFAVRYVQECMVGLIREAVEYIERTGDCVRDDVKSMLRRAIARSEERTLPEGISVEIRHVPERAFVTRFLAAYGWMTDACVVTKVTFA